MKSVIVGYRTALAYWSSARAAVPAQPLSHEEARKALFDDTPSVKHRQLVALERGPILGGLPQPYDIISSNPHDARSTRRGRFHVQRTPFPEGSLAIGGYMAIEGELTRVLIATPELCFVQMGTLMGVPELVELGFELCGDYAVQVLDGGERVVVPHLRVSTPEKLAAFAHGACGMRGAKRARSASRWVLEGARSPEEARIAYETTLSHTLGGYGVPKPVLNAPIPAQDGVNGVLGDQAVSPDLYWPQIRTVLECYDDLGRDARTVEADARKRNALEMMGVRVLSMTYGQFDDELVFSGIMNDVRSRFGLPPLALTPLQQGKRVAVHEFLVQGERCDRAARYRPRAKAVT